MDIIRPEVLAPAGDAERLKAAVYYGADAVYMGGTRFGMRAAPKNFSDDELAKAVSFAHENGVKVYLTCNIIPNTAQLKELPEFEARFGCRSRCADNTRPRCALLCKKVRAQSADSYIHADRCRQCRERAYAL